MAKRTKKNKSNLKLEALETRQLLAGVSGSGTELTPNGTGVQGDTAHFILHPNGNQYDQVLLTGGSVTVTNDPGQITRVSFLDVQGDIVQAEFSGAGSLTISMADGYTKDVVPANYNQPNVKYVQGLASFTIQGSDSTSNFNVFTVGSGTAFTGNTLFDATHTGGNHVADVARLSIVADPANPNGSTFGSIFAGNAKFSADTGVVGIAAAGVQVQGVVRVGNINATGTATPTLTFGTNSQFGAVDVQGGDLTQANGKSINNAGSYGYGLNFVAGADSAGTTLAAQSPSSQLSFTGANPIDAQIKTFTLTTGVDTFTGTAGPDKFVATTSTITGLDTIDGGAGSDTLIINDVGIDSDANGTLDKAGADTSLLTVSNVENLQLTSAFGLVGDALNTTSGWSGLTSEVISMKAPATTTITAPSGTKLSVFNSTAQQLTISGGGGGDVQTIQNGAGAIVDTAGNNSVVTANFKGGTTVDYRDKSGNGGGTGSKTTTVTLDGNTGASTITANGLTTLNLNNIVTAAANTTITSSAGTRALTINVNKDSGGQIIADAEATSLTLNSSTNDSTGLTLNAAKATSLTINSNTSGKGVTLTDVNIAAATGININGAGNTTISANTTVTALTSINASGASGSVTITAPIGNAVTYTGGSGTDKISVGATTKPITVGAGDDTVTLTGNALGTGGSVDGGAGTNTLSMTAANAASASLTSTLGASLSNFQKLVVTAPTTDTIDMSKLLNIGNVDATGATADTFNNLPASPTINYSAATTAINANIAVDSTADVANVIVKGGAAVAAGTLTLTTGTVAPSQSVETVNVTTNDTAIAPGGGFQHTLTLVDSGLTTLKVNGSAGANITLTGDTAITSIDASGITKGAFTVTTPALTNVATIKGSASGADSITATAATKAVTVTTGTGGSTVVVNNANANTVDASAATNAVNITTGSGADTIKGGSKADTISSGTGLDTLTGGAGNDTFVITTPLNGGAYATITDLTAGDLVQLPVVVANATGKLGSAVTQASTSSFANYLDAATQGATVGTVTWFQYTDGNTYIVEDNSALATFQSGVDVVLRVNGLVDLSNSTLVNATNVLTIV